MEQVDLRTVGMLALIIVGVVWMIARNGMRRQQREQRSEQLNQEASARGWEARSGVKDGAEQNLVTGQSDGIAWKVQTFDRSGHGRNNFSESYTEWSTVDAGLASGMIVVVDASWRKASGVSKGILSDMVEKAIKAGKTEKELYKKARPAEGGSETLNKRYFVLASPGAPTERFLSEGAEAALLGWPGEPKLTVAVLWEGGLVVKVMAAVTDAAGIEKLSELGMGLAQAARR